MLGENKMANEIKKEDAPVKGNVESAKVEEKIENNEATNNEVITNIFKSFDIQPKQTNYGLGYYLKLKTYGDYEFEIKLSETQMLMINEIGKDNCKVSVEGRYSQDKRKAYSVIALNVGDVETFDLFPRDRTTLALAKLHYNKYANK